MFIIIVRIVLFNSLLQLAPSLYGFALLLTVSATVKAAAEMQMQATGSMRLSLRLDKNDNNRLAASIISAQYIRPLNFSIPSVIIAVEVLIDK